jgi:rod shape-determining protein MreC
VSLTDPRIALPGAPSRRSRSVLALTLVACLLLMSAQARSRGGTGPSLLDRAGLALLTPVVEGASAVTRLGRSAADSLSSYFFARRQNGRLSREVEQLELENFKLRAEASEARRLRALVRGETFLPNVRLAAPLLAIERRGGYRRGLLGAGSRSGVEPGSPLAVPDGLVGRVLSVSPTLAKVILITDADCAVGARVVRTGEQGVIRGEGSGLRMDFVSALARVVPGDRIETAGIDGIFPAGIAIGTVHSASRGKSLFLAIRVDPAASMSRVSDVLVLAPAPVGNAGS